MTLRDWKPWDGVRILSLEHDSRVFWTYAQLIAYMATYHPNQLVQS